ncbi:hypothetical protein FH972_020426 [Carpinus fangiana]|uniref:Putative plant transposon protein domain-containing protein n=1 Tax=Carpinus fangiana TaxID=176857 RepID=A0A5N6RT67_9ROSI|nr:hypothetical protein FH972_020426 [Carpinus fangiana]
MEVSVSGSTVRRKCAREEKAILQNKILTGNIVIERGVVQSDLLVKPFRFIHDIFRNNQWTSLFTPVDAYPRLVQEFYYNIESIKKTHELSFKTKVLGNTLTVNATLISEVTGIPLTNEKVTPYLHTEPQPPKADIMAVLNPGGGLEWDDNKSNIPIGHVRAPERLLTWIVMQNIWPISRNIHVPFDRAIFICGIIRRVLFCLCSHFLLTMLELYEEHSIVLPYEGLITKILKAKLPSIPTNERLDIPEGPFGKGMVMKSNAQLQRFQAQGDHAPPIIPDPQVASSSGSSVSDVSTQLNEIIGLLRSQGLGIEAFNTRLGVLEKDVHKSRLHFATFFLQINGIWTCDLCASLCYIYIFLGFIFCFD